MANRTAPEDHPGDDDSGGDDRAQHAGAAEPTAPPGAPELTAVVADDRPVVRAGLRAAVAGRATVTADGDLDGLSTAVETHDPDVAVTAVSADAPDPFRAIAAAAALHEDLRVLALVDAASLGDLREAVIAGVQSLLLTTAPLAEVADAAARTAAGERELATEIAVQLAGSWREVSRRPDNVTARELEVLELLAEGLTNKEVAGELDLSPRTVKTHVQSLLRKLDVGDRTAAVATALRRQLIR